MSRMLLNVDPPKVDFSLPPHWTVNGPVKSKIERDGTWTVTYSVTMPEEHAVALMNTEMRPGVKLYPSSMWQRIRFWWLRLRARLKH